MTTETLDLVIKPNEERPIIGEIGSLYVHNLDSIFFFKDVPPKVFLVNNKGSLINQWDMDGAPVNWGNVSDYALYRSHQGFYLEGDKFYLALNTSTFFRNQR